jgi:uncharacterized membrane protein
MSRDMAPLGCASPALRPAQVRPVRDAAPPGGLRSQSHASERGAVIPLVALALSVLMVSTAFAVDLGRVSLKRRDLQAVADAVALDMSRLIDGRSASAIYTSPPGVWDAALTASRARNEFAAAGTRTLIAELGCYVALSKAWSTSCAVPDSVRVQAGETVDHFFQPGTSTTHRVGYASRQNLATFSLGTSLAQLQSGNSTLLNPIMSQLLGGTVNLAAVSYQGLAAANVTLAQLAGAAGVGTVNDLLNSNVTMAQFAQIAAQALDANGQSSLGATFYNAGNPSDPTTFYRQATTSGSFRIGDVLAVDSPTSQSALDSRVNLFQLLMAGAMGVNANSNPPTFLSTSVTIPPISLAGISNVTATSTFHVITPPVIRTGPVGTTASTAQLEFNVTAEMDLNVTLGLVNLRGRARVPLEITGAGADATLTAIRCLSPVTSSTIDLDVVLDGATASIDAPQSSPIVTLRTVPLIGSGVDTAKLYTSPSPAVRVWPPSSATISNLAVGSTGTASGTPLDFGGVLNASNLAVQLLGGPVLNVATLRTTVIGLINPVLTTVTSAFAETFRLLGISSPSADVHNLWVTCGGPALVG